jgi:hypothetical protein
MRATTVKITLSCSFLAMAVFAWTQTRRPDLWEMTTTTTWQQSPLPAILSGANSPFAGGTNTTRVCLTQAQIEKYGAMDPHTLGGACQVNNIVKKANSMTADMICSGTMNGKGSLESSWNDDQHTKGKVHFVGVLQAGTTAVPMEWTSEYTSVFKDTDCGDVKPLVVPERK